MAVVPIDIIINAIDGLISSGINALIVLQIPIEDEETMDEQEIKEKSNTPCSNVSLPPPNSTTSRKIKHPGDRLLDKAFEILASCESTSNNDESQDFGNLVAKKLRCNDLTRCVIQNAIMGIFLDAYTLLLPCQITDMKCTSQRKI